MAGSFPAAQVLMASCHSPSDDPPSPMKDSATRIGNPGVSPPRAASILNAMAMPVIESDPTARGAAAGSTPHSKSPVCRSLPPIGGPALPICARSTMATASSSWRIASVMPRSRITGASTSPPQVPSGFLNFGPRRRRTAPA